MNFSLQVTSWRGKSFDSYPRDFKSDFLKKFSLGDEESLLVMWIEAGVAYYYSLFKLPGSSTFGLLLGFKDMIVTKPNMLLKLMAAIVSVDMPKRGSLLYYTSAGTVVPVNDSFADAPDAIGRLRDDVQIVLDANVRNLGCQTMQVPELPMPRDVEYMSAADSFSAIKDFLLSAKIVVLSSGSAFTSDKTLALINDLRKTIQTQDNTISKLERSRKQYRFVLGLLACLCVAGFGIYNLNKSLTRSELNLSLANDSIAHYRSRFEAANDTIADIEQHILSLMKQKITLEGVVSELAALKKGDSLSYLKIIAEKQREVVERESENKRLSSQLKQSEARYDSQVATTGRYKQLAGVYPFLSTGFSKAGSTLYISYNAVSAKKANVEIRCYTSTMYLGKCNKTVSVEYGSHKLTINDVSGLPKAQYVVLYYEGSIIGGQWF